MSQKKEKTFHQNTTDKQNGTRDKQSWYERPHEQLVEGFRNYIEDALNCPCESYGGLSIKQHFEKFSDRENPFTPEQIIHNKLSYEVGYTFSDKKEHKKRGAFFSPIYHAWNVIAYDRFDKVQKHMSGSALSWAYEHALSRGEPDPEKIKFHDPLQTRILDALAEAAGISHEKGQAEIEIPERLRNYEKCLDEQRNRRG